LRPTGGAVAEELWTRYGDAIAITVGTKPFPPDRPPLRFDNRPRLPLPAGGPEHDGVRAEIVLDEPSVRSGERANGRIVLHNSSDRHVTIHGGQMVGCVVRPGTTEVMGVGTGPVPLVGMTVSMIPGGQGHFPLWVGTASVLPGPDPCLPAGAYEAVAVVHVTRDDVLVARAPLTLT